MFQCPFIMMTEVGAAYFSPEEAARLREYLLKGGFLWADDFWGEYAWQIWAREIGKVLPPSEYPIVDLPITHPLFRSQFVIQKFPQIPSIGCVVRQRRRHLRTRRTARSRMRARSSTRRAT